MKYWKKVSLAAMLIASLIIITNGCKDKPTKGKVKLVYVEWARATAITHVAEALLEKQGYDVIVNPVANAAMWTAVGDGSADALLCAWLPTTHGDLKEKVKDQIEDLGANYVGAKLGLVVPSYVTVNSIPELSKNIDKFEGKIIGIDPGAGMMKQTEKAVKDNISGLGTFKLQEGSGATMTAALGNAIKEKKWIVVTGWKPHWKFGRWDLKILEDPDNIYGEAETINTIVNAKLSETKPEVYQFLKNFDWKQVDLGKVLVWNKEGMKPEESAKKFIKENRELFDKLVKEALEKK